MADDLIAWLRTQIDEDERVARAAQPGDWILGRTTEADWGPIDVRVLGSTYFVDGEQWPKARVVEATHVCVNGTGGGTVARMDPTRYRQGNANHVVRHGPARAVADVEAKRRILELHEGGHECSTIRRGVINGEPYEDIDSCSYVLDVEDCSTVRLLALPYATEPGYREEWRP